MTVGASKSDKRGVDGHFWSEVIYGWLLSSRSKSVPIILYTTYIEAIFVLFRLCTSPQKQNQIPAYVLPNASEDLFTPITSLDPQCPPLRLSIPCWYHLAIHSRLTLEVSPRGLVDIICLQLPRVRRTARVVSLK